MVVSPLSATGEQIKSFYGSSSQRPAWTLGPLSVGMGTEVSKHSDAGTLGVLTPSWGHACQF